MRIEISSLIGIRGMVGGKILWQADVQKMVLRMMVYLPVLLRGCR